MTGGLAGTGLTTTLVAVGAYLGAMLLAGLLSAMFRVRGLHRNGLLEDERLGRVVREYLDLSRRFQIAVSSLYLLLTIVAVAAATRLSSLAGDGAVGWRGQILFALLLAAAWTFGGMLFKLMASGVAFGYARVVGGLVYPLLWLLRPWSATLLGIMDRLDDTLWAAEAQPMLSEGEIRSLIDSEVGEVDLDAGEREMIHSIFAFHDTAVREIMVPRIDMVACDVSTPIDEVIATVNTCQHSRIPVYEGGIDRVIGVLYAKTLLDLVQDGRVVTAGKNLGDLIRPAYFVPESKKIDEVLDEFRAKHIHVAIVIDEYGGTAGLVTLEDVLEEIVGEIEDEFDEEERLYEWVDANTLRVDAKIDLEDLEELLGVGVRDEDDDGAETLGGLIYTAAGSVPGSGDRVELGSLAATVESVTDNRILMVTLRAAEPLPGYLRRDGESQA
jgi:CBS domain containing-hemolysin-like protein